MFDVPAESPLLASRTADLADEYGRLIAASVPGVRARTAVIARQAVPAGPARRETGLRIDRARRDVRIDGQPVRLTYRELELLCCLAASPGRTVSRAALIASVWHDNLPADSSRTVDTHVRRVRAKLGRFAGVLTTIRGSGYRFDPRPDVHVAA
ncbi:Transcriptional regulatory protein, C terminal [Mycolicibacterium rutilum]|uniref:Transcriptional regulatory protein, C terminal n=1 Tax=Mycolicibacterium rutilum TaxID=370526 RepID=A0A1H6KQX5_MYCRU|nr:Transcriptional regulatory protein, C terminal [Mycolicibacterium rutilum]